MIAATVQDRIESYVVAGTVGLLAILFFTRNLFEKIKSPSEIYASNNNLTITTLIDTKLTIPYTSILRIKNIPFNGNAIGIYFVHNLKKKFFMIDVIDLAKEKSDRPVAGEFVETVLEKSVNLIDFKMENTIGRFIENPEIWGKEPNRIILNTAERRAEENRKKLTPIPSLEKRGEQNNPSSPDGMPEDSPLRLGGRGEDKDTKVS